MQQLKESKLEQAFKLCRKNFIAVLFFSFFINILMFVGPIYMLQVYDRVLTSQSEITLIMITVIAVGLLAVFGVLESVRSRILVRTGIKFDSLLGEHLFKTTFRGHVQNPSMASNQPVRDLDSLRDFLTSGGIIAFCDAPWAPVFIIVCFLMHPWLGMVALIGAIVLFCLALANEYFTRDILTKASTSSIIANQYVASSLRNAETVHALGMMPGISSRWGKLHTGTLGLQAKASDVAGIILSSSKMVRMSLQVAILGVGAYLVLQAEITAGVMIAASIIMGRALSPVEQAVGQWKNFSGARNAHDRLKKLLTLVPAQKETMSLPAPKGALTLEQVMVAPPGVPRPLLKSVNMYVEPGDVVAVIGPSGAGKSTLARALVGVWRPLSGHIRLDGADLDQWDNNELGPHIGYLTQDVELFGGTVAENISRFSEVDPEAVVEAAERAGAHEMILQLRDGYSTRLGEGGQSLSGGQRQRIGLARALYGDPKLIVLDEPNSSLDKFGEQALSDAILRAKEEGRTVIVISHRSSLLNIVDKVAVLKEGVLIAYGPKKPVLEHLAKLENKEDNKVMPLKASAEK